MELVFWTAFAFIAYTYIGYPAAAWCLARRCPEGKPDPSRVLRWPDVTVVVPVYNGQDRVEKKIRNLRDLNYEPGEIFMLFVSDGSTDETNARIARHCDVTLLASPDRRGKPSALNHALASVDTEVVVFTDVRQELERDAVRYLVAQLLEPGVGAVSGELVHRDPATDTAQSIGLYWRYEKWIRRAESRLRSTVGVTGALYAIRRRDYVPLPVDTLVDDLVVPMEIVRRGGRAVFEPRALVFDELQSDTNGERKRKVRTLTGNFQAFARYPWLFSPRRNPVLVQLVSHKLFRLFVPYALVAAFVASVLATGPFYRAAAVVQSAFYAAWLVGRWSERWRRLRLVNFAVVFFELNWAAVLAMRNFITGRIDARWEKTS